MIKTRYELYTEMCKNWECSKCHRSNMAILNTCPICQEIKPFIIENWKELLVDVKKLKKEIENFKVENKGIANKAYNEALQDVLNLIKSENE